MTARIINLKQHTFRSSKLQSVVNEAIQFFLQTPTFKLPPPNQFIGSGVYGIYYVGKHEKYRRVAQKNDENFVLPIYVGKAVPPGWRTARSKHSNTPDLHHRLHEHARSIKQAASLRLSDFCCRFMILSGIEGDLAVPVEAELIRRFKPLLNTIVDGFGNHDPGSGRYEQAKSEWDILHPGRLWTKRLKGKSPRLDNILRKISEYEKSLPLS